MAATTGALVFLLSEHGKPYSRKGFGNKFRQWCDEAGLPQCSAHGLRKAGRSALCRGRLLESADQIMDRPHDR
jgi:hypothetical protein